MTTSVQKAIILVFFMLLGAQAEAATFTAKTGTNLPWNGGSNTWIITGAPANSLMPTAGDNVIISNYNTVVIPAGPIITECLSLLVTADNGSNTTEKGEPTTLDLQGNTLRVYGDVTVSGLHKFKVASIILNGGNLLILQGYDLVLTHTDPRYNYIDYTGGGTVGYFNQTLNPLPVELISFKATKKASEVALTWETASEKNNRGFEVQSSVDGRNYEAIGFVASQNGTSSSAQRYAFTDKTANKEGLVYYRLKQLDLDGTFEYFSARVIDLGRFTASVNVYPNPFQNQFRIALEGTLNETADVVVTDMTGKTVYQTLHVVQKGANILNVSLTDQPAGLYLIKATAGGQTYINRLVKQ